MGQTSINAISLSIPSSSSSNTKDKKEEEEEKDVSIDHLEELSKTLDMSGILDDQEDSLTAVAEDHQLAATALHEDDMIRHDARLDQLQADQNCCYSREPNPVRQGPVNTLQTPKNIIMATDDKTVRQKGSPEASTQRFLPVSEIRDGVAVLKNGGVRAILKTSSVNFNLKSVEEQNALIYAYQGFVNTLEFPVQILVRSRKLDIDVYVANLTKTAKAQQNPLLRKQTFEYIEYIKNSLNMRILWKKFLCRCSA